jgi:hypothetical protein
MEAKKAPLTFKAQLLQGQILPQYLGKLRHTLDPD